MLSLFIATTILAAPAKANCLINPDFKSGLAGWTAKGDVTVVANTPSVGKLSLRLGSGKCVVSQRYKVPGLRILWFGVVLQPSEKESGAKVRMQCFDHRGHLLQDLSAPPGKDSYGSIYMKTQAFTDSIIVSIEKDGIGTVIAHSPLLTDDDKNRVEHLPEIDLDQAMTPIWEGSTVYEESVLLLSEKDGPASGRLLFQPSQVMSVKDASLKKVYIEGQDFRVSGNVITAVTGSTIPTMSRREFPSGELPWPRFDGRHVFVTYKHNDRWTGPIPESQTTLLPSTSRRLEQREPLTIVAYGDSITLGVNVSGFRNVPPYLPPWPTLATNRLKKAYANGRITLVNASLGGTTSQWARDNAKDVVAPLKPNLVLIAFGMNDFWGIDPATFKTNIESTMATIKARCPQCEFVLVSSMRFDAAYTTDKTYNSNFTGYARALRNLTGPGVALMDMTKLSEALFRATSHYDLASDPMHPDDFLSRWYAQALVRTLGK